MQTSFRTRQYQSTSPTFAHMNTSCSYIICINGRTHGIGLHAFHMSDTVFPLGLRVCITFRNKNTARRRQSISNATMTATTNGGERNLLAICIIFKCRIQFPLVHTNIKCHRVDKLKVLHESVANISDALSHNDNWKGSWCPSAMRCLADKLYIFSENVCILIQ